MPQLDGLIGIVILIVILVFLVTASVFIVQQQTAALIERFGRFNRVAHPGLRFRIPWVERIAWKMDLRVRQSDLNLETKTKDNVFVRITVSTQYRVDPRKITEAFYELSNPELQIASYIEDSIRSALPTLTLDEAFEKKDDIAVQVSIHLSESMAAYGYVIVKTLITSIEPATAVKESMNEINAAQRKRVAAQELAEADRIRVVTAARAEAEKDQLHGQGIANERREIVNGLSESFKELADSGLNQEQVFSILLANQYIDALHSFALKGNSTVFLPNSPTGADDFRNQMLEALAANPVHNPPRPPAASQPPTRR
ncbi:MAG: SPFH domain-containing protein [Propionibacteriaceae bacterium]|jgi:regulator of protease activity HflC (stomatin/prohibitin superfamily)|nr:SPFH domain-containing protein [Propionibacteriaceae bacterium]